MSEKENSIENLLSDSQPSSYLSFYGGTLRENSYGCGCSSFGYEINKDDGIEAINSHIESYQQCINKLISVREIMENGEQ